MRKCSKLIFHSLLLFTIPSLAIYPQASFSKAATQEVVQRKVPPIPQIGVANWTYDEILEFLDFIENGNPEDVYTEEDLQKTMDLLILFARQGLFPGDEEGKAKLEADIEKLLSGADDKEDLSFSSLTDYNYQFIPAVFDGQGKILPCKNWFKKIWKTCKEFFHEHKTAVIVGTVVVVVVVTVIIIAAAPAAAPAVAGAAAAASSGSKQPNPPILNNIPSHAGSGEGPKLESLLSEHLDSFKETMKETIITQQYVIVNPETGKDPSSFITESGRIFGSLTAHDLSGQVVQNPAFVYQVQQITIPVSITQTSPSIDQSFSTDYSSLFTAPTSSNLSSFTSNSIDIQSLGLQIRGESALKTGNYQLALEDFNKILENSPNNSLTYLSRGMAHFSLGNYQESLQDYQSYTSQNPSLLESSSEFTLGIIKGLPQGIYDSGEKMLFFLSDAVNHPIRTASQMFEAIITLKELARSGEWSTLVEVLVPEACDLVADWDSLSLQEQGERSGYLFGKYGADLIIPGALAKAAGKSVKSVQKLAEVSKSLKIAQETLVLETAAGIGNSATIAEVIKTGRTAVALGEELGFTAREIGQLKQAGKLEAAIDNAFESLINKPGYEVLKTAINEEKHVKFIRDYFDKSTKELQKSVKSLEKLVAEHKDKIANPSKFIPDWETLHPERKNALINKKWPAEIQCYSEQKDILQNILNQRIEN